MGMDVYGKKPANRAGEYFRRNVWGWRPLWNYIENQHPEIASLVQYGYSNDGDGLDAKNSLLLAMKLESDLQTGKAQAYVKARNEHLAGLPLEECNLCDGSGIRTDEVGVEQLMPYRELRPELREALGRDKGWCNGCDGKGTKENFALSYFLDEQDLQDFAQFLRSCGGFEIC